MANMSYFLEPSVAVVSCQYDCGLMGVSEQDDPFLMYNFVLLIVILPVIVAIGITGNSLAVFIFTRKNMASSSPNCYLCGLALSDILVLLTSLFMFTFESVRHSSPRVQQLYLAAISVVYPLGTIAHMISVYITMFADIDCFVGVCCQRLREAFCRPKVARGIISFAVCLSLMYNAVHFWEIVVVPCMDEESNETIVEVCATDLRKNPDYNTIYYVYMYTIFIVCLPLAVLIVLTVIVIVAMFKANKQKNLSNSSRQNQRYSLQDATPESPLFSRDNQSRTATSVWRCGNAVVDNAMDQSRCSVPQVAVGAATGSIEDVTGPMPLIMVVILFIFCNAMSLIINFLESFSDLGGLINYLVDISNLLVVVNSSFNFFIYYFFDPAFKRTLLRQSRRLQHWFRRHWSYKVEPPVNTELLSSQTCNGSLKHQIHDNMDDVFASVNHYSDPIRTEGKTATLVLFLPDLTETAC